MDGIGELLERTCKSMIKTLLACLSHATKGTVYRVGPMPGLQVVRITSGIRQEGTDEILWGLPAVSDYNYPGKSWEEYRDRPDHVLEAMGWCVEKQESWTAEDPFEDVRSVRKQLRGEVEDYYHMEPVLVRKADLYGVSGELLEYPLDWRGNPIWQNTEYVVVAVIKIHFLPNTIHRDDKSTKIIRELSRTLGTELLSLHLRQKLLAAQKEFTRQRLQSCEILAHELRNTLIKLGFVFSAIKANLAIVRQGWEEQLQTAFPNLEWKGRIIERLDELIRSRMHQINGSQELVSLCEALLRDQQELMMLNLLPDRQEQWVSNRIQPKWEHLVAASSVWHDLRDEILLLLERLKASLWRGRDPQFVRSVKHLPLDLCERWAGLAYAEFSSERLELLDEVLGLLEHPAFPNPYKRQMRKTIRSLKVLAEVIPELEERANRIIYSLRQGTDAESIVPLDIAGLSIAGLGSRGRDGLSAPLSE